MLAKNNHMERFYAQFMGNWNKAAFQKFKRFMLEYQAQKVSELPFMRGGEINGTVINFEYRNG